MGDPEDGRSLGAPAVSREEPGDDEGVHERGFFRRRLQSLQRCRLARRYVPDCRQRNQLAKHCRKACLHRIRKLGEHFAGAGGQGSLNPTQVPIRGECQGAIVPTSLVKLVQREFQQGKDVGIVGLFQQHVVQVGIGFCVGLERQAGRDGRLTDDLRNVGRGRRPQVVLPAPLLQPHQLGDLAQAAVEIAPQCGDHPGLFVALGQGGNRVKEPNPILGDDVDAEELLELIDDQGEPRFRLRFGAAAPARQPLPVTVPP